MENLNLVLLIALPILLIGGYFGFRTILRRLDQSFNNGKIVLIPAIHELVKDAVKYAVNWVEQLDKSGELAAWLNPHKTKAEEKLRIAVETAVEQLEIYVNEFIKARGLNIVVDIPEQVIIDFIHQYLWENPLLFPSSKGPADPNAGLQAEQTLEYPTEHARLQPANYPASEYKAVENVAVSEESSN